MKRTDHISHLLFLGLLSLAVFGLLNYAPDLTLLEWLRHRMASFQDYYVDQPSLVIVAFCVLHFISATTGFPGGCTTLNMAAGAVFGFWLGCLIVYPVTISSACVMYFMGRRARTRIEMVGRFADRLDKFRELTVGRGHLLLVMLRLSPLLPFNVINFFSGVIAVPFILFLGTCIVGIFFDVVLLNSIGAQLVAKSGHNEVHFILIFLLLLGVSCAVYHWFQVSKGRGLNT
jgi:uncharacterized membrane protein YdjX (TVP38/TMEM64 family)